jgi:hypothetical protein
MNQHRNDVEVGDKVFFYISGKEAGIYAVGRVDGNLYRRSPDHPFGEWGVPIFYEGTVEPPVPRSELLSDEILGDQLIFTRWQGTNWPLPEEAAAKLAALIADRGNAVTVTSRLGSNESTDTFAQLVPPSDDPEERILHSVRVRRGQPSLRAALLDAYEGRCAISGHGPIDVLEAAHIQPHSVSGHNSLDNALLLRSDIHTLFDAGLLWISPKSLEVRIAPSLRKTPYEMLHGVQLRARKDGSRPSEAFLQQRFRGE